MSEWIPTAEREPPRYHNVLISDGVHTGHARITGGQWEVVASNDQLAKCQVTHWMEFPEPPKQNNP